MSGSNPGEASRIAASHIERHLALAFDQLEAGTGSVEMRKCFHALLVGAAISTAARRFPDNAVLIDTVEAALNRLRSGG